MGPKTIYLVVPDGGADWVTTEHMVKQKYPWIHFIHCVSHECSLIVKDIFSIPEVAELISWATDCQKWFTTSRTGPLFQQFCNKIYDTIRTFIYPADTRFAVKLLQLKRFLSMQEALQRLVNSAQYKRLGLVNPDNGRDDIGSRVLTDDVWRKIQVIT